MNERHAVQTISDSELFFAMQGSCSLKAYSQVQGEHRQDNGTD